jgi:hypothetical protein
MIEISIASPTLVALSMAIRLSHQSRANTGCELSLWFRQKSKKAPFLIQTLSRLSPNSYSQIRPNALYYQGIPDSQPKAEVIGCTSTAAHFAVAWQARISSAERRGEYNAPMLHSNESDAG